MKPWILALRAEALRLRRTLALAVALAAPTLVAALYVLYLFTRKVPASTPSDAWPGLMRLSTGLWSFLMMPLLVALQTALVNQPDHAHGLARVFNTLPVPRARPFLARLAIILGLLALSTLVLYAGVLAGGLLLRAFRPDLGFSAAIPLLHMLRTAFLPLGGALMLLALHYWISHRYAGMALALGTGIGGTVASFLVINSERWGRLYPWALPARAAHPGAGDAAFIVAYSSVGFLTVVALACWEVSRREVA